MWTDYFNLIKLRRGRVIVPVHGEIDFSRDDIPVEICKELFGKGFPYLELTERGKMELYGMEDLITSPDAESGTLKTIPSDLNTKQTQKRKKL